MATATNTGIVSFPNTVPQTVIDNSRSITHLTAWTAASAGDYLMTIDITDVALTTLGQTVRIPAGQLVITQPETAYNSAGTEIGSVSSDMAERLVRGAIEGGIYWQAHYGAPGNAGTANALTELGRITMLSTAFTVAQ